MKCKNTECIYSKDCGFLDITKKQPDGKKCSWYTTNIKNVIKTCKEREDGPDTESSPTGKRRSLAKKKQPN